MFLEYREYSVRDALVCNPKFVWEQLHYVTQELLSRERHTERERERFLRFYKYFIKTVVKNNTQSNKITLNQHTLKG